MPERTDRKREMSRQLSKIGWKSEFFSAMRPESSGDFSSIGARGCFLSHLSVLKTAATFDRHLVLMEDDLNFNDRFIELWSKALGSLPAAQIFYPAHGTDGDGVLQINHQIGLQGAHFMVSNKRGHCFDYQSSRNDPGSSRGAPTRRPYARRWSLFHDQASNPDLRTYAFAPSLGYQRSSRSDIEGQKFFDRVAVMRPAISALRKVKQIIAKQQ
jgi:glycosyl transferase, family 25